MYENSRTIISVSGLNSEFKHLVSSNFPLLWVEGEISNLARPASGHLYFSLKDAKSQVRCVMFRTSAQNIDFNLTNGLQVIIRARASVYEPRGDLQLIAEHMEEAGFGALQKEFEQLKKKLSSEGLFSTEHKQSIPTYPREIAIISSPSGAAIRDYLQVATRRYPLMKKSIYSVPVQGEQAAEKIIAAIQAINKQASADLIVLIRGGGSIEDLWAFNNELLARAIFNSAIPIVTGIGHEIDYTISDFVADLRAPTPSVAAELTTPDISTVLAQLNRNQTRLYQLCKDRIETSIQQLDWLTKRLKQAHPATMIAVQKNTFAALQHRLNLISKKITTSAHTRFSEYARRLYRYSLPNLTSTKAKQVNVLQDRLSFLIHQRLEHNRHQLALAVNTLNAISPLATLERGFTITSHLEKSEQHIINDYSKISPGDQLVTYFSKGSVVSLVQSTSSTSYVQSLTSKTKQANQD
jgi:exodeoxyribonuclease VII large subunit